MAPKPKTRAIIAGDTVGVSRAREHFAQLSKQTKLVVAYDISATSREGQGLLYNLPHLKYKEQAVSNIIGLGFRCKCLGFKDYICTLNTYI